MVIFCQDIIHVYPFQKRGTATPQSEARGGADLGSFWCQKVKIRRSEPANDEG